MCIFYAYNIFIQDVIMPNNFNNIYLPTLKKIKIDNFSLYNGGASFEYSFVNGVNLIIGGNGTGKTTLVNIIKYALIGLYKSETEAKIYMNERKDKRKTYPYSYFRDRSDKSYSNNKKASVTLNFSINNNDITITRNLYTPKINNVYVNNKILDGNIVSQQEYDTFQTDKERKGYLQYSYENTIAEYAGVSSFDDFITFIIDVLIFDERRNTVLWDSEFQTKIMIKYFTSPENNMKYQKLSQEIKYNDSLSRHKSEDARAVKKVIDEYNKRKATSPTKKTTLEDELDKFKKEDEILNSKINDNIKEQENNINKLAKLRGQIALNEIDIEKKEKECAIYNEHLYSEIWEKRNPKYSIYEKNLKLNNICPMCNKELTDVILDESKCFLCHQPFSNNIEKSNDYSLLSNELADLLSKKSNLLAEIAQLEDINSKREINLSTLKDQQVKHKLKIITNEKALNSLNTDKDNKGDGNLLFLQSQYNDLLKERDSLANIRNNKIKDREDLSKIIKENRISVNAELSNIFSNYAHRFTGLKSFLSFQKDNDNIERYIPNIDNILREDSEALSESQRFFIDHSFRMSILEYFYTKPTFFICETPESSLDISYEENAANVFLKYLEKDNSLILTINLNNNEFIRHIIKQAKNVDYINLLDLGKKSLVQSQNETINEILNEIRSLIDEKNKR